MRTGRGGEHAWMGVVLVMACEPTLPRPSSVEVARPTTSTPTPSAADPATPKIRGRLRWTQGLPELVGTSTGPAVYAEARSIWATATTAFARSDVDVAAHGFIRAAEVLRRSAARHPAHQGAFRAGRCMAYENLAATLQAAGRLGRARSELRRARVEDPECRATITTQLRRLKAGGAPGPKVP